MYQLLLYVHIMSAVVWVGGAIYVQAFALRVTRSSDPAELPRFARHTEYIGTRLFMPAAVLLFISGAVMTIEAWSFGQAWIAGSIALFVMSAVAGAIYLGPRAKRAAELFEAEGGGSTRARQLTGGCFSSRGWS